MSMIISLKNGMAFRVSDRAGGAVESRWTGATKGPTNKPTVPLEDGTKVVIDLILINGIFPATVWEEMLHAKNGDWSCSAGEWHKKGTGCAHKTEPPGGKAITTPLRIAQPVDPEMRAIMARNVAYARRYGVYGYEGQTEEEIEARKKRRVERKKIAERYRPIREALKGKRVDKLLAKQREIEERYFFEGMTENVVKQAEDGPKREYQGD